MFNPFNWLATKAEEAVDRGVAKALLKYVPAGEAPPPPLADLYQMLEAAPAAAAIGDKAEDTKQRSRK